MKRVAWFAAAAACAVALAGCASMQRVPYEASAKHPIHTIALVTVRTPTHLTVSVRAPAAAGFGIIGAAIEAGEIDRKSNAFTAAAKKDGYSLRHDFTSQLEAALEADGYKVDLVAVQRDGDAFLKSYAPPAGADAVLDVVVHNSSVGYRAAGDKTDYYPYVDTSVRLVSVKNEDVLYQEQVIYNPIDPPKNALTIPPDQKYGYKNFHALMANTKVAVSGLEEAVQQVARSIASEIK